MEHISCFIHLCPSSLVPVVSHLLSLCQATAEAICKRIGLFEEGESPEGKSFSGRELDDMKPEKQKEACLNAK